MGKFPALNNVRNENVLVALFLRVICLVALTVGSNSYAQVTLNLTSGWNLVGNSSAAPINVIGSLDDKTKVTSVWSWDNSRLTWEFYSPAFASPAELSSYATAKGYQVLRSIDPGKGFWINATQPFSLTLRDTTPYNLDALDLNRGWNLVSTGDVLTPMALEAELRGTNSRESFSTMWAWNTASSTWTFYAPSLATNGTLASYLQSKGYGDFGSMTTGNGVGFWLNSNVTGPAYGSTTPQIAPSVPPAAIQSISKIVSPLDKGVIGGTLIVPTVDASHESALLALNANGKIVLAALVTSDQTVLSADSTALTLTRFSMGKIPESTTPDALNKAVRLATKFASLVYAIEQSLASGTSPVMSPVVMENLAKVVSEVLSTLSAAQPTTSAALSRSLASTTVTTTLPFVVFPAGDTSPPWIRTITAVGVSPEGGLSLMNRMQIIFSVSSSNLDGSAILAKTPDGTLLLPAASLWESLAAKTEPFAIPGNGSVFNVTLSQSAASRTANIIESILDMVGIGLNFIPGETFVAGCVQNSVAALLQSGELAVLVVQPTPDNLFGYLKSLINSDSGLAILCNKKLRTRPNESFSSALIDMTLSFAEFAAKTVSPVTTAWDSTSLAAKLVELGYYWNIQPKTVGVCLSSGQLIDCPQPSLSIRASSYTLTPGSTLQLTAEATLLGQSLTISGLTWSSDHALVSVSNTGLVSAESTAVGSAIITLRDPASGALSRAIVDISQSPAVASHVTLSAPSSVVRRGDTLQISATQAFDTNGNVVAIPPIYWKSEHPDATISSTGLLTASPTAPKGIGFRIVAREQPSVFAAEFGSITIYFGPGYTYQGGLVWAPTFGNATWDAAKSACANFKGLGQSDWRMPTKDELLSFANSDVTKSDWGGSPYFNWTSSPYEKDFHYYVVGASGNTDKYMPTATHPDAVCVRP